MPPEGHTGDSKLPAPHQSMGARGVNNLAAKMRLVMFPPTFPFFRLKVDDFAIEQLTGVQDARAEVEAALGRIARAGHEEFEGKAIGVKMYQALRQLIVTGNVLIFLTTAGSVRVYRLDRYVVARDPMGNLLEIVTKEDVDPETLDKQTREMLPSPAPGSTATPNDPTVELYTHVKLTDGRWMWYQEINGVRLPGKGGSAPKNLCPWRALRWTDTDGEDYGRGMVEEYEGDLLSLEDLTHALNDGSLGAARTLLLCSPNGTLDIEDVKKAENLDVIPGDEKDLKAFQFGKYGDFRTTESRISSLERTLSMAFLLNSGIQRNGERVTAEEIRFMAEELEAALGGVYSVMSQELQLPMAELLMARLRRQGRLPKLPDGLVKPSLVSGLEGIGRNQELSALRSVVADSTALIGPQAAQEYFRPGKLIERIAAGYNTDIRDIVNTDEQVEQKRQQQMMQQTAQGLAPDAMKMAAQAAQQQPQG